MGLAASQARFLGITARRMNCEFQSMQVAQEKLSITRDQQRAAKAYQNALDATKLVWESEDADVYDLSYDLMMKPSSINGYNPYLVTDINGKVVLSKSMFAAAVAANIIDKDTGEPIGQPNKAGRDAFLEQLVAKNQVDGAIVNDILALGEDGYSKSGIGGVIFEKANANLMTTSQFIDYLTNATYADALEVPEGITDLTKKLFGTNLLEILALDKIDDPGFYFVENQSDLGKNTDNPTDDPNHKFNVRYNGRDLSKSEISKLTVGDILSGKYQLSYYEHEDESKAFEHAKDYFSTVLTKIAESLGYGQEIGKYKGLYVNEQTKNALEQALEFSKMLLNSPDQTGETNYTTKLSQIAQEENCIIQTTKEHQKICSVSLTNMVKSFLTNFAIALEGFECGYNVDKESVKKSNYVTDDYTYQFALKNDAAMTNGTLLNADFYNMLYNQIALNGACTDPTKQEMVTDNNYLEHALKNGQMFISSLNTDGYYYQGNYTLNGHVAEVKDEDAIARAELDYNVTKAKLNYKEESLELKMKNLDMEIAALNTEFDTVKNLISKNVEKVFTMFSN